MFCNLLSCAGETIGINLCSSYIEVCNNDTIGELWFFLSRFRIVGGIM